MLDYFIYDTSSPSCLSWSDSATSEGKGSAERKAFTPAGSMANNVWQVQVKNEDGRQRSTVARVVWSLFNGDIPDNSVIIHLDRDTTNNRIENLLMISRKSFNYLKAWRHNTANVRQLPSGRWYATIRGYKTLGTFDTQEEAVTIYRKELQQLLTQRGIPL